MRKYMSRAMRSHRRSNRRGKSEGKAYGHHGKGRPTALKSGEGKKKGLMKY